MLPSWAASMSAFCLSVRICSLASPYWEPSEPRTLNRDAILCYPFANAESGFRKSPKLLKSIAGCLRLCSVRLSRMQEEMHFRLWDLCHLGS
jgi:hypothetical protein